MKQQKFTFSDKIKGFSFLIVLVWSGILTFNVTGQTLTSSTDASTPSGLAPGSPAGSYSLSGFENVNLFNGNVNFNLPLLKIGGRGEAQMPINFTLDSVHWKVDKLKVDSGLEGEPPCPGGTRSNGGSEACYRMSVSQSSTNGTGIYYSSNPYKWDWEMPTQYNPGNLKGRRSGIYTGGTTLFNKTLTVLTFTAPDGTEYELRDKLTSGQIYNVPSGYNPPEKNREKIFVGFNGEAVTFISDTDVVDSRLPDDAVMPFYPTGVLWMASGARYRIVDGLVRSMRDRNGNELRYSYGAGNRISSITDSINRTVTFTYSDTADTITYRGFGGTPRTITVLWTSMSNALRPQSGYAIENYDDLFDLNGNAEEAYNPDVASEVILPDNRRYKLFYNPYGELARVELPTGGAIEYDYTSGANSVFIGNGVPQIHRRVTQRRVYSNGGTGTAYDLRQLYSQTYNGSGTSAVPWKTVVTVVQEGPNESFLTKDIHYFDGSPIASLASGLSRSKSYTGWNEAKETKTECYNSTDTKLRTTENIYDQKSHYSWWTGTAADEPANDPRLIRTETTLEDTGQKTKTEYAYDDFNNQTEVKEYDYGTNGNFGALLRRTETKYVDGTTLINSNNYICAGTTECGNQETIHLRRLPRETTVYDASGNVASVSKIEYDNYTSDSLRHAGLETRTGITGLCLTRDAANGNCTSDSTDGYKSRGNATNVKSYGNAQNLSEEINVSTKYDVAGNVVVAIDAKGYVSTISYGDNFGIPNAEARTTSAPTYVDSQNTSIYPINGQNTYAFATSVTNPKGWTSYTQFDYFSGLSVDSEDVNGNVSSVFYNDPLARPTQLISANNRPALRNQRTFVYNDSQAVRKVTSTADLFVFGDNLAKTESFYDGLGRTTEAWNYKDNGYVVSKQEYDALGRAFRTSNPYRGNETVYWTTSQFDALGRVKKVIGQDNTEVNTSYEGNAVMVIDQAGKQRRSVTNAIGQLKRIDEPNYLNDLGTIQSPTQPTSYDYDTLGNLKTVMQGGQTRSFVYDSLSRLKSATNPELGNIVNGTYVPGTIQYTYDAKGNIATRIDPRDVKTNYGYDELNRVTERVYTLSNNSTLPANLFTPNVTYTYEDTNVSTLKGILTKVSSSYSETRYTEFDLLGRIKTSEQRTPFSDTETVATATPRTSSYVYNLSGVLIEQTYPSTRVVKYNLDTDGELSTVQSKKNTNAGYWNYADHFNYTSIGAVSGMRLGNGRWETTQFNERLQPIQIGLGTTSENRTNLLKLDYLYGKMVSGTLQANTNNGNIAKQTITVPTVGTTPAFTAVQYYEYDELNRIKQAAEQFTATGSTQTVTTWAQVFNYDRYGNRTFDEAYTTTLPKACVVDNVPVICDADRSKVNPFANTENNRLDGYTFDKAGNTTVDAEGKQFTYDAENKQTQVKDAQNQPLGTYLYDGDGKRVKKISSDNGQEETTVFIYDASGKLVAEYSTTISSTTEAKVNYLTSDHLGSPRINTDQNGAVTARHDYQPFGEEISRIGYGTDKAKQKFTGYERDNETGLDFAQARYYTKDLGRFTSTDPIYFDLNRVSDPQKINNYLYVRNNPLKFVDPSGLDLEVKGSKEDKDWAVNQAKDKLKPIAARVKLDDNGKLAITDDAGRVLDPTNKNDKKVLDKIGNNLKGPAKDLFKAIIDPKNHGVLEVVNNDNTVDVGGNVKPGLNKVDRAETETMAASSNGKGLTTSDVAMHEAMESYLTSITGKSINPNLPGSDTSPHIKNPFPGLLGTSEVVVAGIGVVSADIIGKKPKGTYTLRKEYDEGASTGKIIEITFDQ